MASSLLRHYHFLFYVHFWLLRTQSPWPARPGLGLSSLSKPDIPLLLLSSSASEKNTARVGERKHNRPLGHKDIILSTCQKPHVKKNRNCGKRTSSGLFFQLPLMEFFISLGKTREMQILRTAGTSMNWLLWKELALQRETAWGPLRFGQCPSLWLSFYLPFHAQWLRSTQTS